VGKWEGGKVRRWEEFGIKKKMKMKLKIKLKLK